MPKSTRTTALIHTKHAAELLGINVATLRKYLRQGDVPTVRLTGARGTYVTRCWLDRTLGTRHTYDGPGLLQSSEAAAWLGVSQHTLRLAVRAGNVPSGPGTYVPASYIKGLIEGPMTDGNV